MRYETKKKTCVQLKIHPTAEHPVTKLIAAVANVRLTLLLQILIILRELFTVKICAESRSVSAHTAE